jgi:VWFA-related protein
MLRSGRQLILLLPLCVLTLSGQQTPPDPQAPQPRPPVFRAGAHYVRVDAYPTAKDGTIVEGLTKDDFEIYEDGKLQAIESAEFITFDTWTPDAERKDPRTQQAAYDLAADPTWRVFVIVIDRDSYGMEGQHYMRAPLHEFIDRNLGPRDLFGLLTTQNEWTDLALGQTVTAANAVIDRRDWLMGDDNFDERWAHYFECGLMNMIPIAKLDAKYALLEGLVKLLSLIRQEKKSIVFVSYGLSAPRSSPNSSTQAAGRPAGIPGVPVGPPGYPGLPGPRVRPPTGGGGGPRGPMGPGDRVVTQPRAANCGAERMRLANIDFSQRFRDLLREARQGNVAFYPVSPAGLQTMPFSPRGGIDLRAYHAQNDRTDTLRTLASETDGVAIVNTNDLAAGMRRIANDLRAYYVLGYYTTNTNWDGRVRSIKVRLKPKKDTIRARRQYRAPTAEEIAGFSSPPSSRAAPPPTAEQTALGALEVNLRTEKIEGAPGTLVGTPVVHRVRGRMPPEPVTALQFDRAERLRVEWPLSGTLDRRDARWLDRNGKPMPVDISLSEDVANRTLRVEIPLAAFARGDYLIELNAGSGAVTERSLLAVRIK